MPSILVPESALTHIMESVLEKPDNIVGITSTNETTGISNQIGAASVKVAARQLELQFAQQLCFIANSHALLEVWVARTSHN